MAFETELKEVKSSYGDESRTFKRRRDAFRRKYKTFNPNLYDSDERKTIFEKILRTPNSANDIRWCVENKANMYSVSVSTSKVLISGLINKSFCDYHSFSAMKKSFPSYTRLIRCAPKIYGRFLSTTKSLRST